MFEYIWRGDLTISRGIFNQRYTGFCKTNLSSQLNFLQAKEKEKKETDIDWCIGNLPCLSILLLIGV